MNESIQTRSLAGFARSMRYGKILGLSALLAAGFFLVAMWLLQYHGGVAYYVIPPFSGVLLAFALIYPSDTLFPILAFAFQTLLFTPAFLKGRWKLLILLTVVANLSCAYWFKGELLKKPMFQAPFPNGRQDG